MRRFSLSDFPLVKLIPPYVSPTAAKPRRGPRSTLPELFLWPRQKYTVGLVMDDPYGLDAIRMSIRATYEERANPGSCQAGATERSF